MIDKKDFEKLRRDTQKIDEEREALIKKSREIVKLSKLVIYSAQRDDMKASERNLEIIKREVKSLIMGRCDSSGNYKIAIQEYVEAVCFYEFIKNKRLPTSSDLKVDSEYYLLGVCDLTGELVRLAVNSAIKKDFETAENVRGFVDDLYGELLKIDFRNSDLRRKIDAVKWDLRKLEELLIRK